MSKVLVDMRHKIISVHVMYLGCSKFLKQLGSFFLAVNGKQVRSGVGDQTKPKTVAETVIGAIRSEMGNSNGGQAGNSSFKFSIFFSLLVPICR